MGLIIALLIVIIIGLLAANAAMYERWKKGDYTDEDIERCNRIIDEQEKEIDNLKWTIELQNGLIANDKKHA